jgi:hypothetical protein
MQWVQLKRVMQTYLRPARNSMISEEKQRYT